ncbi:Tat pathway signal protein [Phenylobacterium sp.]|jgi:hypothetical protein|uniref:Tat pathway signal protein n=1 Tax=Phenylobacterium sp. TaxID=1871053 RepID=UPI00378475AA
MERRQFIGLALAAGAVATGPGVARASAPKKDGDPKKRTGGSSYLPIQPLTATTNKPGGRRGVFTVECGLDVPDAALRTRAEQSVPRLRAAFVQTVQVYAAGLAPSALPNADYLSQALQRQTNLVLGKPGARFLLGAIVVS